MRMLTSLLTIAVVASAHPLTQEHAKRYVFDADAQYVSTSGDHEWQAPEALHMRGPCPGLNALANHGYINRTGMTDLDDASSGMQEAFGIAPDFAAVLAILGASQAGDGYSFSIGGPSSETLAGGLFGQPLGLDNSHNHFEGDCSITRDDLYQTGNDVTLNINFFKQLMDIDTDNYDLTVLGNNAEARFDYCVSNNPYFFRGLASTAIPSGTNGLVAHLMSNKSAEHPEGSLPASVLMSFYSITNDTGDYVYTEGYERFPDNFYKWNPSNEYTTVDFAADVAQVFVQNPKTIAVGGNTGTVNSFVGLDVGDITGGVYNAVTLLQGNNLACFLFQATESMLPKILSTSGLFKDIQGVLNNVTTTLAPALTSLECPQLQSIDDTTLGIYPGWTKMRSDGTYDGNIEGQ